MTRGQNWPAVLLLFLAIGVPLDATRVDSKIETPFAPQALPPWSLDGAFSRAREPRPSADEAIRRVIAHEGGYSAHPRDPGGSTRYGITAATARRHGYRGPMSTMPRGEAFRIYRVLWDASGAARIRDPELAAQFFDAYVAHGPRASAWKPSDDDPHACRRLNERRLQVYRASRNWPVFGRGWSKRIRINMESCA